MQIKLLYETTSYMRISTGIHHLSNQEAVLLQHELEKIEDVKKATFHPRTGNGVIVYEKNRTKIIQTLQRISIDKLLWDETMEVDLHRQELSKVYEEQVILLTTSHFFWKFFLPTPLKILKALFQYRKFLKEAIQSLWHGKLEVSVLDATAILVSLLRGDIKTASSIMYLLTLGEVLEEWTHKKSIANLADHMALQVKQVFVREKTGEFHLVSLDQVAVGDIFKAEMGAVIPLDGVVVEGEGLVDQSVLTGEAAAVHKMEGGYVYAGTVLEEGTLLVQVHQKAGWTRYEKIVSMIESSQSLKSASVNHALHRADQLVPYSFLGTALVYLLTRDKMKALSVLMVDFSCALKLSIPIAVLSALRDCQREGITVKGGKFLEEFALADTIVFDKTGTFTKARPTVREVIPFGGHHRSQVLAIAACLEEHFPHSIANAVVDYARDEGITHDELHSEVEYIVAHGIASRIEQKRAVIGSAHFVFEDEKCTVPEGEEELFHNLPEEHSLLYLAIAGELSAVIVIEDPLRKEAPQVIENLRQLGVSRIVMMTGDSQRAAKVVAEKCKVDEYYAEVLPEDKERFVRDLQKNGKIVAMVGDGINDSPALSRADVGVAIKEGAQIAQSISDITIAGDSLQELVVLRQLSLASLRRIKRNYRFVIGFNMGLIALGVLGVLAPEVSAYFHNGSTLLLTLQSMEALPVKEIEEGK